MRLTIKGREVPLKVFRFPGGEVQVRIEDDERPDTHSHERTPALIDVRLKTSDDVMGLLMLTDAVGRLYGPTDIDLVCPYLPYARQDRVVYPGEALAASVLCKLINAQGYRSVEVWDAHSDVSLALLDRVFHRPASDFACQVASQQDVIVAPDQGAAKRAGALARLIKTDLVTAEKVRCADTGEITGTRVHSGPVGNRDFLIVDDICDGGRTFIELAKVLRPLTTGRVKLYVTHGIFSAGFDVLRPVIDQVFVANPFPDTLPDFVQAL
ncbi:MAG: ribose-phosphate diphosphokinase [Janthinobacterium lividum]